MYYLPEKIKHIIYMLETGDFPIERDYGETFNEEEKKYMIDALKETYKIWKEE